MQGVTVKRVNTDYSLTTDETMLSLLGENQGLEIMLHTIKANDFVMLTPSEDKSLKEYAFLIDGKLTLEQGNEILYLDKNDFFSFSRLENTVIMKCEVPVKLLYITSKPTFKHVKIFVSNLDELINKVDEKDKYTKMHCQHVMDYSIAISKKMMCDVDIIERLAISALFHDVGKCEIPDEILKKPDKLTMEERKYIFKHPISSKKLVEPNFGIKIANIVQAHHERLDGSGYPLGLYGDEIPLEAQIIAVADSFDAMTTKRPYIVTPKTFKEAADELLGMTKQYNAQATKALSELVETGEIDQIYTDKTYN